MRMEEAEALPNAEGEAVARKATKKRASKKRAVRKRARASSSPQKARKAIARRVGTKRSPGRKGYSAAKKAEILAAAKRDKMTGEQVAKKFGISTLTFYRWRGPVRGGKKRGRPVGSKNRVATGRVKVDLKQVRREVQAQVRKLLPQIIREEVAKALGGRG